MKSILTAFALCMFSALAHADTRLETVERALTGDVEAAEQLLEAERAHPWSQLVAAQAFRAAGEDARAVELLQAALHEGDRNALWSLVVHHVERRNWIEAYAWGRLAMLVENHDRDGEIDEDAWPMQWTWQFTQRAARNLRESEFERADRRTQTVVERWYVLLTADSERDVRAAPGFVERRPPTYPRDEAYARETGWSLLMFDFNDDGTVNRIVPLAQTHRAFAERATAAVEDWVVDLTTVEPGNPDRSFIQMVEFSLEG